MTKDQVDRLCDRIMDQLPPPGTAYDQSVAREAVRQVLRDTLGA